MIHYHGSPLSGTISEASEAFIGRHAFVSYAAPSQLEVCLDVCQSVALDNGAFSAWRKGKNVDWDDYFKWVGRYVNHPRVDFAIIPDVIDGSEEANLKLISKWCQFFHQDALRFGVPVWHMHESDEKLKWLVLAYPRVAIGSSAEFSRVGSEEWHARMRWAMRLICDERGHPRSKIHMLRGLDQKVFTKYPFASADSTNAARNCGIDKAWCGTYAPPSTSWRARVIMARIESFTSAQSFVDPDIHEWLNFLFNEKI